MTNLINIAGKATIPQPDPLPPTIVRLGDAALSFNRALKRGLDMTGHIDAVRFLADAWLEMYGDSHRNHRATWACQSLAQCDRNIGDRTEENPKWWRFRMAVNRVDLACNG